MVLGKARRQEAIEYEIRERLTTLKAIEPKYEYVKLMEIMGVFKVALSNWDRSRWTIVFSGDYKNATILLDTFRNIGYKKDE